MIEQLGSLMVGWTKNNRGHISVYSNGYIGLECMKIDEIMEEHDMLMLTRTYSPKLGKTVSTYKKKVYNSYIR